MSYNSNRSGGSSGGSAFAGLIVVVLIGLGLYGGNIGNNSSSNNSEYIDAYDEELDSSDVVDSEILIDSSIEDSSSGIIQVEPKPNIEIENEETDSLEDEQVVESIPTYYGENQITLNDNDPHFTEGEIATIRESVGDKGYVFSELDTLNRPSTATAILTPAMYNTEERDSITVNPTAWKNKRLTDGSWLYNRSHLLAYSFINADIDIIPNLITGTRDFNADRDWGMLHFEDIVREYVSKDGDSYDPENEILYQVTPFFTEDNLLADGVQMRIQSLHDDSLNINVFIYNVQDDVELNYVDGTSVDHTTKD